ncbi:MAG: hypothetical protein ACREQI_14875 [Candidatus Binataceae bacterium]
MNRPRIKPPAAPMLTHFTRAANTASALDNLAAILRAGAIRASGRMVRGGGSAVCLFDAPLNELRALLDRRNRRRYEPFGIAIDKRHAFKMGARPVIYLPWREAAAILPPAEHWRVVATQMDASRPVDWTHEREWRIAGDLVFEPRMCAALVETWRDVDDIFERFNGHPPCAGVIPLAAMLARSPEKP